MVWTYRQLRLPLCHLGRHIGLAEGDGQLQVLLFLSPKPRQPFLLRFLTLPFGPGQLLLLIAKRGEVGKAGGRGLRRFS